MKKTTLLIPAMLFGLVGCNNQPNEIYFDYIFTAQPVVFATKAKGFPIYKNVQEDFMAKTQKRIIQASVFVNKSSNQDKVYSYLELLSSSIAACLGSPVLIKNGIEQAGSTEAQSAKFGVAAGAAFNVTKDGNGFSLGFEWTATIKSSVENFMSVVEPSIQSIDNQYIFNNTSHEQTTEIGDVKVICPAGAPAVAFYNHATDENFTTGAPLSQFLTNNYDIIVAPTNDGLKKIINESANYQIAATITFGNMYIISTGRDADGVMNKGDHVLYFQKNGIPGKVFNYLYGDLELDTYDVKDAAATKNIIENNGYLKL